MSPERPAPPQPEAAPQSEEEKAAALKDKLDTVDKGLKEAVQELQGLEALIRMDVGSKKDQQEASAAYQEAFGRHQEVLQQSEALHEQLLQIQESMKGLYVE